MSPWLYLLKLYRPRSAWLLAAFVSLAVTWLSAAILLALSGWFITASAMAGVGLIINLNIFTPSSAIRALALLRTLGRYLERIIGHEAILRVLADLRVRAFAALAGLPANRAHHLRHADLVNRLTADVDTLDGVPLRVIGPMFAALLTWMVCTTIGWIWGNAQIAIVIGLGGIASFATAWWASQKGNVSGRHVVSGRADQRIAVMDFFSLLPDMLAYQKQQPFQNKLASIDQEQVQRMSNQERFNSYADHAVQAMTATMGLLVLALSYSTLSAPVATLLTLMAVGMHEALGTLPGACWRIGESIEAGKRLMQVEAMASELPASTAIAPSRLSELKKTGKVNVVVSNLLCQYQPNHSKPLNASLYQGRPVILFGKSGSGKSSLLSTMAGELPPLSGELLVDDVNLLTLKDDERYQLVSMMSQSDQLLDVSIREFMSIGRGSLPESMLRQALDDVDLLETIDKFPDGIDYKLGIGGNRISGGQARRLQLASILLHDPSIVLLDEPFRGLQRDLVEKIISRISPWIAQRICVIVTHDPNLLPPSWDRLKWPHHRQH